jgi:serine O-acetyltransferase
MSQTCGCSISDTASIGPGFVIAHVGGIVIGGGVTIGTDCDIRQGITIGGSGKKHFEGRYHPKIGNEVRLGAGAKLIGPISIGDGCFIGANAVVTKDVPANAVVVGVPGRVIRVGKSRIPILDQEGEISEFLRLIESRVSKIERLLLSQENSGD